MVTNTKVSGAMRAKEMDLVTACVRMDEPFTKDTGVRALCMAREDTLQLMGFIMGSSQTANGKDMAHISSHRAMSMRASGSLARGVEQANSTSKLRIVSSKGSLGMANVMVKGKFWTVMVLEY